MPPPVFSISSMTRFSTAQPQIADHPPAPPEIHLVVDGAVVGPVDESAMAKLVSEGRVGSHTLAWHAALDEWAPVETLPELRWLIGPSQEASVVPGVVFAGFARRLAAGSVDTVLCSAMLVAPAAVLGFWPVLIGVEQDLVFDLWFNFLGSAATAAYFVLPMSWIGGGATPGYRLFGLRLIEEKTLRPPGLLRTAAWYVVTFGLFVGWLTYFVDPKRRMLHNLISHTLVILVPRNMSARTKAAG